MSRNARRSSRSREREQEFPRARNATRFKASKKSRTEKNYSICPYRNAAEWLACVARGFDRE